MEAYDPYFDFNDLEVEAKEIFAEFYCNFLSGNLEYLEKVAGGPALAKCKAEIQSRTKDQWKYKYEEVLDMRDAVFQSGGLEGKVPSFSYIIDTQEINCRMSTKGDDAVLEGDDNAIKQTSWRLTLSRHEDPDLEMTGHYWEVTNIEKVGELT